jgi:hypothetical protein
LPGVRTKAGGGQRLGQRGGIEPADDAIADDGDGDRAEPAREEIVVGAIVLVHVQRGKGDAGA